MDELLAIILIVILCCGMFFAWMLSMATCPDGMVNLIGGPGKKDKSCSRDSEEMILPNDEESPRELEACTSNVFLQLNGSKKAGGSKKLSMVPEQDEQLTVRASTHHPYPSILKQPTIDHESFAEDVINEYMPHEPFYRNSPINESINEFMLVPQEAMQEFLPADHPLKFHPVYSSQSLPEFLSGMNM
uniref:TMEM132D_C domain-containing protein n=1 Tax=Steinernema glaseri TaxID=37863 RepID=A0A1I7Y8E6_9BILA